MTAAEKTANKIKMITKNRRSEYSESGKDTVVLGIENSPEIEKLRLMICDKYSPESLQREISAFKTQKGSSDMELPFS